uniref:Putative glucosidase ii catalytic alpha subunit n=1 Tax=Ixodes ricinus TaxID=34613 RepID=A0A0K8RLY0_IXORI
MVTSEGDEGYPTITTRSTHALVLKLPGPSKSLDVSLLSAKRYLRYRKSPFLYWKLRPSSTYSVPSADLLSLSRAICSVYGSSLVRDEHLRSLSFFGITVPPRWYTGIFLSVTGTVTVLRPSCFSQVSTSYHTWFWPGK